MVQHRSSRQTRDKPLSRAHLCLLQRRRPMRQQRGGGPKERHHTKQLPQALVLKSGHRKRGHRQHQCRPLRLRSLPRQSMLLLRSLCRHSLQHQCRRHLFLELIVLLEHRPLPLRRLLLSSLALNLRSSLKWALRLWASLNCQRALGKRTNADNDAGQTLIMLRRLRRRPDHRL